MGLADFAAKDFNHVIANSGQQITHQAKAVAARATVLPAVVIIDKRKEEDRSGDGDRDTIEVYLDVDDLTDNGITLTEDDSWLFDSIRYFTQLIHPATGGRRQVTLTRYLSRRTTHPRRAHN